MTGPVRRGRLITIEGVEGVGKTTNHGIVVEALRERGLTVIGTREPGGTPLAEQIRALLLDSPPGSVAAVSELLLVFAARSSHIEDLIRPAIARGDWVVCDRFTDATFAYQGGGRGLPREAIAALQQLVQQELRPDLTILLEAPPEVTDERRDGRGATDRFETENAAFFARVREAYLDIAGREPGRVRLVDAGAGPAEVRARIMAVLGETIDNWL